MKGDLSLRDVVSREYVGVAESDSLRGTASLLSDEGADAAVVVRGEEPVGVVTPREVMAAVVDGRDPDETSAADVMGPVPPALPPTANLRDVAAAFGESPVPLVLVTDGDSVVGTVAARDLVALEATSPAGLSESSDPSGTAPEPVVDGYSEQSVCERCGALSRQLSSFNGQLLCQDCLEV